mgnify:FL=1
MIVSGLSKKGFSGAELAVTIVIVLAVVILAILFLTGTIGGAGKTVLKSAQVAPDTCIPVEVLYDCGLCQQACCHCDLKCAKADKNIRYGERCDA